MIDVQRTGDGNPLEFVVTISDAGGRTRHTVLMERATAQRLAGGRPPEQCVEAAFRFLLDREPKESILGRFDVTVISRYFPEFEARLPEYLAAVAPDD